ncbi:hypothetical protein PHMEG_00015379 [Phytophthora megakarya]|uniref:Uncharacterized protein n=1 Tax=Phytophthora megakarya TaxID=4795 RepID=A0A225W1F4_9STRA|nr:hypothetical protein PHMEG_00015379 [Phytophthora megakarya]
MVNYADAVETFECEGSFSFLREAHHFTFQVHNDNSLRVDIHPVAGESVTNEEETFVRGTIEDIDDVVDDTPELPQDEETETKLLAFDGRALVEIPINEQHDAQSVCYVVHFKIVQWGRGAQGMWSQIVKCIAHLSQENGMSGRFVDIQENAEVTEDFSLRPLTHRYETLENPLHPLTPGRYELRGITIAENSFVYECVVNMTLQANGMMSGTSRELPFTQECPVAGMWTRSGLNYLLQYEMHSNKHTYNYFGTPLRAGLQGTWQNSELQELQSSLDIRTSRAERGVLEFQLIKAVRIWSEEYHKDYPAAFRECVKFLLLASHRDGILPNHLWSSIVSYCGYNWFCSDLQKSLTSCETKDNKKEEVTVP